VIIAAIRQVKGNSAQTLLNLACQWSLKYWPHTRNLTKNLISISADFPGTLTAYAPPSPTRPPSCTSSIRPNFIRTLRANGGDSAYVPTTSIYSSVLDEIVQPQAGDGASAFMNDARQVGVLNVDLQQTCPLTPAGGSSMATPACCTTPWLGPWPRTPSLHGGPGRLDRIDLPTVSMQPMALGLTLLDVDMALALIPVAGANIVKFLPKRFIEPALPAYAAAESAAPAARRSPDRRPAGHCRPEQEAGR
jgi:hypothetical protein